MFYAAWFGQVLLIAVLVGSIGLFVPPADVAAMMLIVTIVWATWLLASLVRHLMRQPAPRTD
ncbi:MAG: hypothetical protein JWN13_3589 [Betaproteobacteria bacterium]|jgi:hypothetical protein|nr:hypothetical protein [Betaproteobacteria bacterium]MEA3156585.1 hypothetical protein [Betaproteobacteria bacterium]